MAKALLGYVGGPDPRLMNEVRRLQQRVHDLEAEVLRLQAEHDHLEAIVDADHLGDRLPSEFASSEPVLA